MAETRAQRRIRQAVESRGYSIKSMNYEPWYNAGEMMGIGGGWEIVLDKRFGPSDDYDTLYGLSVEELLADIDYSLRPNEPCDCDRDHHAALAANRKGDPQTTTHDPACAHHIKYRLAWWGKRD